MKRSDGNIWLGFAGLFVTILAVAFKLGGMLSALDEIPKIKSDIAEIRKDIADIKAKISEMDVKVDILWKIHLERDLSIKRADDQHESPKATTKKQIGF